MTTSELDATIPETGTQRDDVIVLDAERKSRRERLKEGVGRAKQTLAPSNLVAGIKDEQKEKIAEAGRKVGQSAKDNKYKIGGGAALLAAAAGAFFFWKKRKTDDEVVAPESASSDGLIPDTAAESLPAAGGPVS